MTTKTKEPEITLDEQHIYRVNGIVRPGVTTVLKSCDLIPDFAREEAMLRGRAVHRACELLDLGVLDWATVRDEFMGYLTAYEDALLTRKLTPVLKYIEYRLFHPFCFYCGTVDRVYRTVDGLHIVADIKTGQSIPDYVGEQTAAYLDAYMAMGNYEIPRAVLLLRPDGSHDFQYLTNPRDIQIWTSCLNVYTRTHK